MNPIKKWLMAVRAPFFTGAAVPIIFGTALAYYEHEVFNPVNFIVTLVGMVLAQAGANLANDYYDHKTSDDDINPNFTPFSGGSRMIQNKLVSAPAMLRAAAICWVLALAAGIYLTVVTPGYRVLFLAAAGFAGGFFYTATRFALSYNRLGEIAILLNFGILPVLGAYYVQTGQFAWSAFLTSLPIGFLITAILYINQYPDYEADKAVGKDHLVVTFGKKAARYGYYFLIFGNYLVIVLAVIVSYLSPYALLALLTLPIALKTVKIFNREYDRVAEMIPAMAGTVQVHLLTGLLMSAGCVAGALMGG